MWNVTSNNKNITIPKLMDGVTNNQSARTANYMAHLDFLVLVQLIVKNGALIFLKDQRILFWFRYFKGENFHFTKIALKINIIGITG